MRVDKSDGLRLWQPVWDPAVGIDIGLPQVAVFAVSGSTGGLFKAVWANTEDATFARLCVRLTQSVAASTTSAFITIVRIFIVKILIIHSIISRPDPFLPTV